MMKRLGGCFYMKHGIQTCSATVREISMKFGDGRPEGLSNGLT